MVLTEAMAAGKPVVALDGPGVRDVVEDQVNGRLVSAELRERRQLGRGLQRREELRIAGALQKEADVAGSHRIPRQPYDAGEQRHHHLGVLAGVRDPQFVDRRHHNEARAQDRGSETCSSSGG